jgi:hypothetical protein
MLGESLRHPHVGRISFKVCGLDECAAILFYSILFYLYYIYFKSILVPQLVVPDLGFLADSVLQVFHLKHHVLNTNVQKLIIPAV